MGDWLHVPENRTDVIERYAFVKALYEQPAGKADFLEAISKDATLIALKSMQQEELQQNVQRWAREIGK